MKIEKINDNQIRCTLTKEDLDSHQIRISELAYGTEKAKRLFRDMMQQAQIQFGFEADNIPLMIEAIPVSAESIILIITKVEDPEELDTRFSKFAPFKGNKPSDTVEIDGADNIIDIFQKLCESKLKNLPQKPEEKKSEPAASPNPENPDASQASENSVLHQSDCTPEEFNKVCNILSEYGVGRAFTPAGEAYLREHGTLIADDALQKLLKL